MRGGAIPAPQRNSRLEIEGKREGQFLAALAVGAEPERLGALWGELEDSCRTEGILPMAARAGVLPALGRFSAQCTPADQGAVKRIALGLAAETQTRASLALLEQLAGRPEVQATTPVAIKGAGLTLAGYYEAGERYAVDADVVVPPASLKDWEKGAVRLGARYSALTSEGYDVATISKGAAVVELHAALPGEAGRLPGVSYGDLLAATLPPDPEHGIEGVRTLSPAAARELAVHHFVFHHQGSEGFGLKTLQDLSRLDSEGSVSEEPSGLPWEGPSPAPATALLRRVAKQIKQGRAEEEPEARMFLGLLLSALAGEEPTSPTYAEDVRDILNAEKARDGGRIRPLLAHLFPARACLGTAPDGGPPPFLASGLRYAKRPLALALRYAASRRPINRARTLRHWRRFLEAGGL